VSTECSSLRSSYYVVAVGVHCIADQKTFKYVRSLPKFSNLIRVTPLTRELQKGKAIRLETVLPGTPDNLITWKAFRDKTGAFSIASLTLLQNILSSGFSLHLPNPKSKWVHRLFDLLETVRSHNSRITDSQRIIGRRYRKCLFPWQLSVFFLTSSAIVPVFTNAISQFYKTGNDLIRSQGGSGLCRCGGETSLLG
jgi:hypothetical protein